MNKATDFEHDPAYAFTFPLVGVQIEDVVCGRTTITAWIGGDEEMFRVPPQGYDPAGLPESSKCSLCKGKDGHIIVPVEFYMPPKNPELYNQLKGTRVEIVTGEGPRR